MGERDLRAFDIVIRNRGLSNRQQLSVEDSMVVSIGKLIGINSTLPGTGNLKLL